MGRPPQAIVGNSILPSAETLGAYGSRSVADGSDRIKYLNNLIEQDHRFIKRHVRLVLGFKSFTSGASTIAGVELVNLIRKGQFRPEFRPLQQFCQLAA